MSALRSLLEAHVLARAGEAVTFSVSGADPTLLGADGDMKNPLNKEKQEFLTFHWFYIHPPAGDPPGDPLGGAFSLEKQPSTETPRNYKKSW